jgi:hypothetical protein
MSASERDIIMDVKGVQLVIAVLMRSRGHPARRFGVRVNGSKQEIDEILDQGVLEEIDRKISGGELHFAEDDQPPFGGPTRAGGAG